MSSHTIDDSIQLTDIDALNDLTDQLRDDEPDRAYAASQEAHRLATAATPLYQPGIARSLHQMGALRWRQGDRAAALSLLLEALALAETIENAALEAKILNTLLVIHHSIGNFPEAFEAGYRALKIAEQNGDHARQACLLNDLGYIRAMMGQPFEGLPFIESSLTICREFGLNSIQAAALDSMSLAYLKLGNLERSLDYAQQGQDHARQFGLRHSEAETLEKLGQIHTMNGDHERALACFMQALDIARQIQYPPLEITVLVEIGRLYARQHAFEQALQHFAAALTAAEAHSDPQPLIDIYEALSDTYEQARDFEQALNYRKQYQALREEIFNTRHQYRLMTLQTIHTAQQAHKEAEIYQLKNVALQHEIQEKEQALVELDAFASMVAHDLKSPLSTIIAYCELVIRDISSTLSHEANEFLQELLATSYGITDTVDDLLTFARLRREEMVLEPLDIAALALSAQRHLRHLIQQKNATIVTPPDLPGALGHEGWVREIWLNYLSNAIKYGGQPSVVELGATPQPNGMIRFWVRDNGEGIALDRQQDLFNEFTQLCANRASGHGLGLSIVKRIVEKLGGEVSMSSTPGSGSEFGFTLPAADHSKMNGNGHG